MKIQIVLSGILLFLFFSGFCQEKEKLPVLVSVTNNATLMPGNGYAGIFTVPVHPGLNAGTQISLKDWKKSSLNETFRIGGYYHKYCQLALELYSELIYQYRFGAFAIEPQFQVGFMMAFSDLQEFKSNGESYEERSFKGKPQFMTGAGLGVSYTINRQSESPVKLSLSYLVDLQMPYISGYAPVLIITSLQLGVMFYLPCHHEKS